MSERKQLLDDIKAIYEKNENRPMREDTLNRALNYV